MAAGKFDHLKQEEIAEVRLKYNPNVEVEKLKLTSVVNTRNNEKKIDFRIWKENYLGKKPFEGLTPQGFRLNREQYIEFRKSLQVVDELFNLTKKEKSHE